MVAERRLIIKKANEEAQSLYHGESRWNLQPTTAIPLVDPGQNPNIGQTALLDHYIRCTPEGSKKGVPKQKSLNKIQELQGKTNEDSFRVSTKNSSGFQKYIAIALQAAEIFRW